MNKLYIVFVVLAVLFVSCATGGGTMNPEDFPQPDKLCALTFDDGPDNIKTPRVIEKLKAHNVVATFFLVGQNVNSSTQPLLKEMSAAGYEFGNHSWDYNGLNTKSADEIKKMIGDTTAAIEKYTGTSPAFFRPPNLSTSTVMFEVIDYPFVSGVLGVDWAGTNTSARDRANNVLAGVRDGSIILLHDVQPDPHPTPEALDILIPELKKKGYEFVTLSELFKRKGVDPASKKNGMWTFVP